MRASRTFCWLLPSMLSLVSGVASRDAREVRAQGPDVVAVPPGVEQFALSMKRILNAE